MTDGPLVEWVPEVDADEIGSLIKRINEREIEEWPHDWAVWGRQSQQAPPSDWRVWLVMAGRGFGKTRLGAEWVSKIAEEDPEARIALVGASLHEARSVMVEGESGLLSIDAPWRRPVFESSVRRLVWPNGAQAFLYSAGEPESLRGPQHSHACGAIAEGNHGQRSALADRHASWRGHRGRAFEPAGLATGRPGLAGRGLAHRGIRPS